MITATTGTTIGKRDRQWGEMSDILGEGNHLKKESFDVYIAVSLGNGRKHIVGAGPWEGRRVVLGQESATFLYSLEATSGMSWGFLF